jgi:hypothetical protein
MLAGYLQIVIVSRWTIESAGIILYAELKESESIVAAKDLRTFAKTIISNSGVDRFLPFGAWPTEEFSVSLVQRRGKRVISNPYLVEAVDGRKVWIEKG